jgi:hypothetical protein
MGEQIFYPQVQILHRCIVSSLWAEPTNQFEWFELEWISLNDFLLKENFKNYMEQM